MSDYTPTTQEVRFGYVNLYQEVVHAEVGAEFDRWLAAVKAEAWAEAINHVGPLLEPVTRRAAHADNPYREAAA